MRQMSAATVLSGAGYSSALRMSANVSECTHVLLSRATGPTYLTGGPPPFWGGARQRRFKKTGSGQTVPA